MKIAHVANDDIALYYLLLNQMKNLQRTGYEVTAISAPGPYIHHIEEAGICHIPVPFTRRANTPVQDLAALFKLYRIFQRKQFTIVHTHNPKPGFLGQIAAKLAGVPVIVNTLHGFYFHDRMTPLSRRLFVTLERIAARCSDLILSQNREDMSTAFQEGICRVEKIKYLGNGIDLSCFDPARFTLEDVLKKRNELGIPAHAHVVGFVGRLAAKRKGFLDFLRAAQIVSEWLPDAYSLIVGDADHGKPDAVHPSIAKDYNIADRCIFVGRVPNHELPILYAVMNVLVLPSLFEGIPRVVMEASAMQIPAVVTDVKGNREAVEHGRNGLRVPLGDVQRLAFSIAAILTDEGKAKRMGEEGRQIALERFDENVVFEKVRQEYASLLLQKGLVTPEEEVLTEAVS